MDTGSSVLDRVKQFLPVIEQANRELEENVKKAGPECVVIDSGILNTTEVNNEESDEEETENSEENPVVKVEFALGDFDDTPIAQAEEEINNGSSTADEDS
mmetsp:Transcript_11578/g.17607  ORF Transcript_11578/g.17607 Transcript_11578/m.17607 type:complete len:101 (-) Transcript_11578:86-388(-)